MFSWNSVQAVDGKSYKWCGTETHTCQTLTKQRTKAWCKIPPSSLGPHRNSEAVCQKPRLCQRTRRDLMQNANQLRNFASNSVSLPNQPGKKKCQNFKHQIASTFPEFWGHLISNKNVNIMWIIWFRLYWYFFGRTDGFRFTTVAGCELCAAQLVVWNSQWPAS